MATTNPGKLREYGELLEAVVTELVPCSVEVVEDACIYEANAAKKAEAAARLTGLPALADDSGVEADQLGGFPGVHSARVGPTAEARNALLVARLRNHPRPWPARFVCAIALAGPDRETVVVRGEVLGELLPEPRGAGGFGYDPYFLLPELGLTFAEMPPEFKNRHSHRARALDRLLQLGLL